MTIDATFWVAISFLIFCGLLVYFKIPQKVKSLLDGNIENIKNQINDAEKLKEEAKILLSDHEKKMSSSKNEIKLMIDKVNNESEKTIIKNTEEFHKLMDSRKKNADEKVKQMKNQAIKDIKNASVKITIRAVERLLKNSLDKSKLDKLYMSSIEETKTTLKKRLS
jgi:F-type H+-transporting ATPase subunit b